MKENRLFALIYRTVASLLVLTGLLMNFNVFNNKPFTLAGLVYYTIQSNILVLLLFIGLLIYTIIDYYKNGKNGSSSYLRRTKGFIMTAIILTFLVFWLVLAPTAFSMDGGSNYLGSIQNNLVHTITPLLLIIDWILFDYGKQFKKHDPYLWMIIPINYFIFAIIRATNGNIGNTNSRYPYDFIDFDKHGWMVAIYVVVICIVYIAIGHLILYIDNKRKIKLIN